MNLNERTAQYCDSVGKLADVLRIKASVLSSGTRIWDFGIESTSSLQGGIVLANVCTSNLATVSIQNGNGVVWNGPSVQVVTDHPIAACMASQYAGWQIARGDFFGMGSGPMRAAAGIEEIFSTIGHQESTERVVGVLETGRIPSDDVAKYLANACKVSPTSLTLCVAPTSSQAGNVQIVARSVETALHKMFELGFDLSRVISGFGNAPLPPVAKNDLAGIGRTNDAILYGGEVTLWLQGDDESLEKIVSQVPSSGSRDYGRPFGEIFESYDRDFYKIDPHLFSPAKIRLCNLDTGYSFSAGELRQDLIESSFLN